MNIVAAAVTSVNGKITPGENVPASTWASKEDQEYFFSLVKKARLIIMGRKTYETAKLIITLTPQTLRVVITKNPEKYSRDEVPGQLVFTSDDAKTIVKKYEKLGYKDGLLVGGSQIYAQFLEEGLINEFHITVEPWLFGKGTNLAEGEFQISMKLAEVKRLNEKGTLLFIFRVLST